MPVSGVGKRFSESKFQIKCTQSSINEWYYSFASFEGRVGREESRKILE